MTRDLPRRREDVETDTHGGRGPEATRGGPDSCGPRKAKDCPQSQELEEARKTLPESLQSDDGPAHPLSLDIWPPEL